MPLTTVNPGLLDTQAQYTGFKNRIINGAMMIDQRNAGALISSPGGVSLDRWAVLSSPPNKYTIQQNAGSVTPPAGFSNYLGCTSTSAYSVGTSDFYGIYQAIEGFNFADLNFGTANAATVTISFWVRSSLTGTFGGAFNNYTGTRAYPFSYTISAANTWERKTITIAGDTSGTWVGATNAGAAYVLFSLGAGSDRQGTAGSWVSPSTAPFTVAGAVNVVSTNGATFYITGVQLEKGSTATSFDYRPYGTELALCQRYYSKSYLQSDAPGASGLSYSLGRFVDAVSSYASIQIFFPVSMRAIPTVTAYNPQTGTINQIRTDTANLPAAISAPGPNGCFIHANNASVAYTSDSTRVHYTASAEL